MNDEIKTGGQVTVLRALQFASYATMVMIATYFPLYFYSLGYSKLQIGAIYSVGPVLSIVSNLLAGVVSDKTKSLRRVISLLYLGQILALALLLPVREFGVMSLVMAGFYLFQTPVNPMLDSLTLLAAERMRRSFPSIRMFGSLGYALCAVLFGIALKVWGSGLTIYLALGTVLTALIVSLLVADFQASVRKFEFRGLWNVLRRRDTVIFFVVLGVVAVPHRVNEGFLSVAMRDHGASDSVVGAASLASSISEIPIFFLLARYGHRFKEFPLLALAGFMYMIRMLLLSVAVHPWSFVAIQTLHSVTFGIFYIVALRCLQSIIPEEFRSSGQAAFTIVWGGIAGVIAGTLGGWMYDTLGLTALFRTGAAFALAGCLGFLYFHFRRSAV
jgi:PPP family 3-phenylpropionic acid transporter